MLIVDEAQQMAQAALDALLPTMSAVDNTQIIYTGTVPDELNDSEAWEGVRDRGRSGSDPRTGWMEFSPPGSEDPDVADKFDARDDRRQVRVPVLDVSRGRNRTRLHRPVRRHVRRPRGVHLPR
ncbi:hypothetical protein [Herbiconiux sp.]|uniref:hypothetical protein n=1 Tax=Herbiconiux sp. TaxID=1871186 RepID=UPI0025BC22AB|nr:hypothetical protein [Herbiconiux sp.]